jgi:hypothetical protein
MVELGVFFGAEQVYGGEIIEDDRIGVAGVISAGVSGD